MFDKKLMKYNNIIGYGYEIRLNEDYHYYSTIYTYLVLYKNGIKFKKYKKFKPITDIEHNNILEDLIDSGYAPIKEWISINKNHLLDKKQLKKN